MVESQFCIYWAMCCCFLDILMHGTRIHCLNDGILFSLKGRQYTMGAFCPNGGLTPLPSRDVYCTISYNIRNNLITKSIFTSMKYFTVELASQKYFIHFPTNFNRKSMLILRGGVLPYLTHLYIRFE